MNQRLTGKRAIVTGGTRGIGRAVAERLLEEGASVVLCSRDESDAKQTAQQLASDSGPAVHGVRADVAKRDDVERLFQFATEKLSGLDILINNAGVGLFKSTGDMSPEEWDNLIAVNLNGAFYCAHEAIKAMRGNGGGGHIVNISSLAGKNPFAGGAAYNASKFGLNGFSEAMMMDHRQENIRVSYVMPGSVDTSFGSGSSSASWKIAPEDIAEIVANLLSMPNRTLISRVEVRPSKPPQK